MHKKITSVVDTIFINLILYFICFVWIRYYTANLYIAIFLAILVTVTLFTVFRMIFGYRSEKTAYKKKEREEMNRAMLSLAFLSDEAQRDFVSRLFPDLQGKLYIRFRCDEITKQDIAEVVKDAAGEPLTLVAGGISAEVKRFIKQLPQKQITVLAGEEVYDAMKEKECFPPMLDIKPDKIRFKDILAYAFCRSRAKGYVFTGMLLLITSFFIPFKLYYIITGSILLILSLVCLGMGNRS